MKNFFFYQARKDSLSESKDVEEEVRSLMESKSYFFRFVIGKSIVKLITKITNPLYIM